MTSSLSLSSQLKYSRTQVVSLLQQMHPTHSKQNSPSRNDSHKDLLGPHRALAQGSHWAWKTPILGKFSSCWLLAVQTKSVRWQLNMLVGTEVPCCREPTTISPSHNEAWPFPSLLGWTSALELPSVPPLALQPGWFLRDKLFFWVLLTCTYLPEDRSYIEGSHSPKHACRQLHVNFLAVARAAKFKLSSLVQAKRKCRFLEVTWPGFCSPSPPP